MKINGIIIRLICLKENEYSEEYLRKHYADCGSCCRILVNKMITSCAYSHFAEKASIVKFCKEDYLDLSTINSNNKIKLVEFVCGFNTRGYVELCKHCAGIINAKSMYIEVAVQIPKNEKIKYLRIST